MGNVLADLRLLFPSMQAKQIELQFTIGEAITSAAVGTSSVAARDAWLVTEEEYTPPAGTVPAAHPFRIQEPFLFSFAHLKQKKKCMRSILTFYKNIYIILVQSRKIVG